MSKKLKAIGFVSFLTTISRVLGLARDSITADVLGGSVFNDAFLTAFSLPNLFRRLLGEGALTAAFIPTLQEELAATGKSGAFALLNRVVSWLAVVTASIAGAVMLVFGHSRLVPGRDWKWYLVADLSVIMFPYLALICIAAAFNATLNVLEHFIEPALSPIWLNIAMIVSLAGAGLHFAHTPLEEVHWLCAGVLVGGFFQMTVPAVVLMRLGWRPGFILELAPRVRQIGALMAPAVFGTAIYQINLTVSRWIAYSLPESTATVIFLANRLMELPIGIFAIAVATVVYPLLSKHAAEKNYSEFGTDFRKGIRLILLINLPAAAGLAALREPIVRLIYRHGHFTAENAHQMAQLLGLFVIGLPLFSVVSLTVRAFYAVKDTKTPVRIAAVDFVVNVALSLLLKNWFGAAGLVIASTVAIALQTWLLQRALRRRFPEVSLHLIGPTLGKIVAGTALMGLIIFTAGQRLALRWPGRTGDALTLLLLIPVGIGIYGGILWALKIEGREELLAAARRIFRRRAA